MANIIVYSAKNPAAGPIRIVTGNKQVKFELSRIGVGYESMDASETVSYPEEADEKAKEAAYLKAYETEIARLSKEYGIKSLDVKCITASGEKALEIQKIFNDVHTHADHELRFFVAGSQECAVFYIHTIELEEVFAVICGRGDFLAVPELTPHWFDMVAEDGTINFAAIRLFSQDKGWIGIFLDREQQPEQARFASLFPTMADLCLTLRKHRETCATAPYSPPLSLYEIPVQ